MNDQPNYAFYRALHSLTHPLTIAAVVLLLVNDHWLRHTHPTWLTGKLGDFSWLVFAPFIAALLFAWLIPRRIANHERIVGLTAFTFIGLWFATAKTMPLVHHVTTTVLEAIIGWEGTLRLDVTDLLTLPALLIGWWVWTHAANRPVNLRPLAYVALALGIFGTLASDGPSYLDNGISEICEQDGQLNTVVSNRFDYQSGNLARYQPTVFSSSDGGLTWNLARSYTEPMDGDQSPIGLGHCTTRTDHIISPDNSQIQYRWEHGEYIERSTDGGQTWSLDYELFEFRQDVRRFHNHRSYTSFDTSVVYLSSPVSGLVHSQTGNVVLAMSQDGVLVRTPNGEWQWVAVGGYRLAPLDDWRGVAFQELWMAGALAFLVVTTSTAYIRRGRGQVFMIRVGWLGWVVLLVLVLANNHSGRLQESAYDLIDEYFLWGILSLILLFVVAIPMSLAALVDIARNFRHVAHHIFIVAIGTGGLFILPFILWTQGRIPPYNTAFVFSLLLTAAALYAGSLHLRRVLPPPYSLKEKRKRQPELEMDES